MRDGHPAEDHAAHLLERQWFAANRAASEIRAECDALAKVREMAEDAWRDARSRLCQIESLRDALGDELSAVDQSDARPHHLQSERSAA